MATTRSSDARDRASGHSPLAIRRSYAGEAWEVARVRVRSIQAGYAAFMPHPYLAGLSVEAAARRRRAAAANEEFVMLVAARGGRPVGLLNAGPAGGPSAEPGVGEIYQLFMDPSEFGSGAAHALFTAGARALKRRAYHELVLWVLERNVRARRFYASHGWRADGGRAPFRVYGYPVADVRYRSP